MCTNKRFVTNKYTGQRLLVDCGSCPACLQAKANKLTNRIRDHYCCGKRVMFLTLTYDRISCPFVDPKELANISAGDTINIYREYRVTHSRTKRNKRVYGRTLLGTVEYDGTGLNNALVTSYRPLKCLKHRPYVGVCYYKDFQNFFKRLRINLNRNYGFTDKIDFFGCSEMGAKTKRPHFHAVLFVPQSLNVEEVLRPAIVAAWPYASKYRTSVGLEYPRKDVSSYVASYINCFTSISCFHRSHFPPKRSFSKCFGALGNNFTLASLLDMFDRGDFSFVRKNSPFSKSSFLDVVPARIVSRYFPKIKGYSRLSDTSLLDLITNYPRFLFYKNRLDYSDCPEKDDYAAAYVTLVRGYNNFCRERRFAVDTPDVLKWTDYMFYYERLWSRYYAFKKKFMDMQDNERAIPLTQRYTNINEVFCGTIGDDGLKMVCANTANPVLDPNEFDDVVRSSAILERYFWQRDKQRKVTNMINDQQGAYM